MADTSGDYLKASPVSMRKTDTWIRVDMRQVCSTILFVDSSSFVHNSNQCVDADEEYLQSIACQLWHVMASYCICKAQRLNSISSHDVSLKNGYVCKTEVSASKIMVYSYLPLSWFWLKHFKVASRAVNKHGCQVAIIPQHLQCVPAQLDCNCCSRQQVSCQLAQHLGVGHTALEAKLGELLIHVVPAEANYVDGHCGHRMGDAEQVKLADTRLQK